MTAAPALDLLHGAGLSERKDGFNKLKIMLPYQTEKAAKYVSQRAHRIARLLPFGDFKTLYQITEKIGG